MNFSIRGEKTALEPSSAILAFRAIKGFSYFNGSKGSISYIHLPLEKKKNKEQKAYINKQYIYYKDAVTVKQ